MLPNSLTVITSLYYLFTAVPVSCTFQPPRSRQDQDERVITVDYGILFPVCPKYKFPWFEEYIFPPILIVGHLSYVNYADIHVSEYAACKLITAAREVKDKTSCLPRKREKTRSFCLRNTHITYRSTLTHQFTYPSFP